MMLNKNISYIVDATFPNNSAYSVHIMKMCEAFSLNGANVTLYINKTSENQNKLFEYYGIKNKFEIEYIHKPSSFGFLNRVVYSIKSILKSKKNSIYTRDPIVLILSLLLGKKAIFEAHGFIEFFSRKLDSLFTKFEIFNKNKVLKVVCISDALKKVYIQRYKIEKNKVIVLHDGVNLDNFSEKKELFTSSKPQIAYMGSLYQGKGIEIIIDIAKQMKDIDFNIYGGEDWQIKGFKSQLKELNITNIIFHGHVENSKIPQIQSCYDVLLMPYKNKVLGRGTEDISRWMSPMKMFEYMASGKVIISSSLSVIQEVLNDDNAYLVEPDNIDEWVNTISLIMNNKQEAILKTKQALKDVQNYTWQNRAKQIMEMINE